MPKTLTQPRRICLSPKWSDLRLPFTIRGPGSDEDVLKEVVDKRCYRRAQIGFEIRPGETWLDLGANIGAFAACCYLHGAKAVCYEPEPDCFKLLKTNIGRLKGFELHNSAVTTSSKPRLQAKASDNPDNHYRLTFLPDRAPARYIDAGSFQNKHVSNLLWPGQDGVLWDGVKLDIEGSELSMIDQGLLPRTNKLVMEYHFSRDDGSMPNFHRRMKLLRELYEVVKYPPSLDKHKSGVYPGRFDINVFCMELS